MEMDGNRSGTWKWMAMEVAHGSGWQWHMELTSMANVDWASCTTWPAYSEQEDTKVDDKHGGHYVFTPFILFFKDCDSTSGIGNLRHTYGTISIHLKMNTFSLKKIDGLPAKFLSHINIGRS